MSTTGILWIIAGLLAFEHSDAWGWGMIGFGVFATVVSLFIRWRELYKWEMENQGNS